MKFFIALAALGANALSAWAAPQVPVVSEYVTLLGLCTSAGADAYVGVLYVNGFTTTFDYGECYPYELPDGTVAEMAVFCKSVTCENNPNPDCTGGAVPPVPIPVPALTTLINAADFVQIIGQGATCQPNGLLV